MDQVLVQQQCGSQVTPAVRSDDKSAAAIITEQIYASTIIIIVTAVPWALYDKFVAAAAATTAQLFICRC